MISDEEAPAELIARLHAIQRQNELLAEAILIELLHRELHGRPMVAPTRRFK